MKNLSNILVLSLMLIVTACSTTQNEWLYGAAGASLGGLLGAQFGGGSAQAVSGSAGALAGAALGANIGSKFDDVEKLKEKSINIG